jgi:hypothetical protein
MQQNVKLYHPFSNPQEGAATVFCGALSPPSSDNSQKYNYRGFFMYLAISLHPATQHRDKIT